MSEVDYETETTLLMLAGGRWIQALDCEAFIDVRLNGYDWETFIEPDFNNAAFYVNVFRNNEQVGRSAFDMPEGEDEDRHRPIALRFLVDTMRRCGS